MVNSENHESPSIKDSIDFRHRRNSLLDVFSLKEYRVYWSAAFLGFIAMMVQVTTQGWIVYEMTKSPLKLGIVSSAFGFPLLLFSLIGGTIADRFSKRKILIVTRLTIAIISLIIAVLLATGNLEYWHLVLASVLTGLSYAFSISPIFSIIPELVPRKLVVSSVALATTAQSLGMICGPALAGIIVGTIGKAEAYFTAVTFYFIAFVLFVMLPKRKSSGHISGNNLLQDLVLGLKYVKQSDVLPVLLILAIGHVLFLMPYQQMMPVFADILNLTVNQYGYILSMAGIGAVIGSVLIAILGQFRYKGRLLLVVGVISGVILIAFANNNLLPLAYPLLILLGIGSSMYVALNNSLIMLSTDEEYRGRVTSIYSMTFGLMPIGTLPLAGLAERIGAPLSVTAGGGLLVFLIIVCAIKMKSTFYKL
jgi:MFS family permease